MPLIIAAIVGAVVGGVVVARVSGPATVPSIRDQILPPLSFGDAAKFALLGGGLFLGAKAYKKLVR